MDGSKIEVGDVFTFEGAEYTCRLKKGGYVIYAGDNPRGVGFHEDDCRLVRKADPYHGISLPPPPDGYRLAKWGEEWRTEDALWFGGEKWVSWKDGSEAVVWHKSRPRGSIFAIPLDQPSPLKSWQFREVPWVAPQPKTLADVPDGRVIHGDGDGRFQFWKSCGRWWIQWPDGTVGQHSSPPVQFTVTNYIAEFRGPA